jgi:hypothetical protein
VSESVMSKRTAKQLRECREIVKEIRDFGINEFMTLQIINLLSLELESREAMIEISEAAKKYLPDEDQQSDLIL